MKPSLEWASPNYMLLGIPENQQKRALEVLNGDDEAIWTLRWLVAANELNYSIEDIRNAGFFKKAESVLQKLGEDTEEIKRILAKDSATLGIERGSK